MAAEEQSLVPAALQDVERAERMKAAANRMFNDGDWLGAYEMYTRALRAAPLPLRSVASLRMLPALRMALFAQRAQASLRLGWLMQCVNDCSAAAAESLAAAHLAKVVGADDSQAPVQPLQRYRRCGCLNDAMLCQVLERRASAWEALGFEFWARRDLQEVLRHARSGRGGETAEVATARLARFDSHARAPPLVSWEILPRDQREWVCAFLPVACLGKLRSVCVQWSRVLGRDPTTWAVQAVNVLGPLLQSAIILEGSLIREDGPQGVCGRWAFEDRFGDGKQRTLMFLTEPEPDAEQLTEEDQLPSKVPTIAWETEEIKVEEASELSPAQRSISSYVPRWLSVMCAHPPIVIDIGMLYTKAGRAGADTPSLLLPNTSLFGNTAITDEGMITADNASLELLLQECFERMSVEPQEHSVILCMSSYQRRDIAPKEYHARTRILEECLISVYGVQSVHTAEGATLALAGHGVHTGLVVDIGLGSTRVVPVVKGQVLQEGFQTQYLGAANCTNYLLEVVNNSATLRDPDRSGDTFMLRMKNVKEDHGFVAASRAAVSEVEKAEVESLRSVLDRPLHLGPELAILGEMFFRPELTGPRHSYYGANAPAAPHGLHELVCQAALAAGDKAGDLLANVVVAGGTASMPGMQARLEAELQREVLKHEPLASCRPRVLPHRLEPAWFGGSLLGAAGDKLLAPREGPCEPPVPRKASHPRLGPRHSERWNMHLPAGGFLGNSERRPGRGPARAAR